MNQLVEEQRENLGGCTGSGFLPGQSGNPGGRPKGSVSLTTAVRKMLSQPGRIEEAAEILWREFQAGNPAIVKEVWNRIDGKVVEPLDLTVNGIPVMDLTDDQLQVAMQAYGITAADF